MSEGLTQTIGMPTEPSALLMWENQERQKDLNERSSYFSDEYRACVTSNQQDRDVFKASMNNYIGINGVQWPAAALQKLASEGRPANTYNASKIALDKIFGQLTLNPRQVKFASINQDTVEQTNIMDSLYEYDYERGNYKKEWNRFVKDTIIHTGVIEMYIDYSNSTLGNVGIRALNRYTDIEFDAFWNSDDINDARYIFKTTWLTAREIKDMYQTKSREIDDAINAYENIQGMDDFAEKIVELADQSDQYFDGTNSNNRYKVLEVSYMQRVPKTKKYEKKISEFLEKNALPGTSRSQTNTPIDPIEYESICKIMTLAPGLNKGLILQEGEHPVQCGRLPYFVASTDNTMGTRQGYSTAMIDAQTTLNKRNSMLTGAQITSANGALIVKEGFFKDSAEYGKFVSGRNKPGAVFKADDNAKLSDGIMQVPTGQMPEGLQNSIDWNMNFIKQIANDTDAISGRSGGANESGVLFESKKSQSAISHVGINETLSIVENEMAEAYFYTAKPTYSGPNRKMRSSSGDIINMNKRVPTNELDESMEAMPNASVNFYLAGAEGNFVETQNRGESTFAILNEIAKLPRHSVIIKKSELGLDQKQHALSVFSEMSQRSTNPIAKTIYEQSMAPLLDLTKDVAGKLGVAGDIFIEFQMEQMKGNILSMKAQNAQSELVIAQSNQQLAQLGQPQQPPQPGQEDPTQANVGDSRTAANGPGQGSLPEAIAQSSTGANNKSASDV